MEQKKYTFSLSPGEKERFPAGNYDVEKHKPLYEIEISCTEHVRNQIEEKQLLLGTPENCHWAYEIYNKSSWNIFIIIKKDGVMIRK